MGNPIPSEADCITTTRTNQEVSAKVLELHLANEQDEAAFSASSTTELVGRNTALLCRRIVDECLEVNIAADDAKVKELVRWLLEGESIAQDTSTPARKVMLPPCIEYQHTSGIVFTNAGSEPIDITAALKAMDEECGIGRWDVLKNVGSGSVDVGDFVAALDGLYLVSGASRRMVVVY
ncbi:unnamed protein product [Zymoseptoria tritici ST99CH_3D7]|uniref:Uncharacterized protein n=2 Tax=Zymoseptoria tritici TaxID=1047171 RepID=A0A1X7RT58_ZYMT9|nr:unnamed protein product [Zymoseptoria tritici ST99CH_3D7]SMR52451.1 unnamed protein product [Zymoseptoria tritici ST99CH_1E4]